MPLHKAATRGHTNIVEFLLGSGVDVNVEDDTWNPTALHKALDRGHAETAQVLIANGADIETRDYAGKTALDRAKPMVRQKVMDRLNQMLPDNTPKVT